MQRAPRRCACGHTVQAGTLCACQRRRAAQADAKRPTSRQRGYSSKWERESKAFLALPGNDRCACGCGRPADMVDHRRAHRGDARLFWDRRNWQPMAKGCNSRKAVREEGGFGRAPTRPRGGGPIGCAGEHEPHGELNATDAGFFPDLTG